MIEHFLPHYWTNLLFEEIKKTSVGEYIDFADSFQNWGDIAWTLYGRASADHGMYFNFFVNSIDKVQKIDSTEARQAIRNVVYDIEKDIYNYIAACYRPDDMPPPEKCRVVIWIPRIKTWKPERGFCDGIKGLVLCGLIKIGDEPIDNSIRPYQP